MIIDEMIEVGVNGMSIKHFEDKGYTIPRYYDSENRYHVKKGTKILVHSYDLMPTSKILIHAQCDCPECGRIKEISYCIYYKSIKNTGSYYCSDCKNKKSTSSLVAHLNNDSEFKEDLAERRKETCMEKYGVSAPAKSKEVMDKMIGSILDKYGTLSVNKLEEIQQKKNDTIIEQYGSIENFTNIIAERRKETMLKRYNVPYYSMCPEYNEKVKKTCLERYGYENSMQSPECKKKLVETMHKHGTAPTSSQQKYICEVLGMELNYPCESFIIDMVNLNDKIALEYDGSGHDLSVKLGVIDRQKFTQKQFFRNKVVKRNGYKIIRIISNNDLIPSDDKLIEMYNFAKNYFNTTSHTWIDFYPEENKYRNTEHMENDGSYFDYGELRKIKKQQDEQKEVS